MKRSEYIVSTDLLVLLPDEFLRAFPEFAMRGLAKRRTAIVTHEAELAEAVCWLRQSCEHVRCAHEQARRWTAVAAIEGVLLTEASARESRKAG